MSGIWDRLIPGGELADRIPAHTLQAAIYLVGRGIITGTQARAIVNGRITTPLSATAETDLANIVTQAGTGTATAKLDYMLRLHCISHMVEIGALTVEATFRSELGIA